MDKRLVPLFGRGYALQDDALKAPHLTHYMELECGKVYAIWHGLTELGREIMAGTTLDEKDMEWYTGYAHLHKPLFNNRFKDKIPFVEVHGGITYARESHGGGFAYGFDCHHYEDFFLPKWRDGNQVFFEALMLYFQLLSIEDILECRVHYETYEEFMDECKVKVNNLFRIEWGTDGG